MATSPNQFLRFLADNTDLVTTLFDRGEVDEAELLSLIARQRSDTDPAVEHLRRQIEEFGIIEAAAHADATFELSQPVVELLAWLTRRQRLSSATVLRAYLDDIGSSGRELADAVSAGDPSAAALALRDLDKLVERVRALSDGNRESVVSEAQEIRSATDELSAVDRFTTVRRLWERHLEPLRQLVVVEGEMELLLDRLRSTLDDGEQRFLAHGPVQRGFSRSLARLARMRRAAFDDHHAAIVEVAPLYERLRRDSRWLLGASRALARTRMEGTAALRFDQRMGLTGWRTRYLMSDEKLKARLRGLVGYEPHRPPPLAEAPPPPDLPIITRSQLREAVDEAVPIDDVLAFVLERWPDYVLSAQLGAFGHITGGAFGPVVPAPGATSRMYPVPRGSIEAWPLALTEVTS